MFYLPLKPFYFIRHGETDWNRRNIIMGQTDIPLNNYGIEQAIKTRELFENISIENIYTSPLKRALRTAEILNKDSKCSINIIEELKERGWGEGEGCLHNISLTSLKNKDIPRGAEKWEEFELRTLLRVQKILNTSLGLPLIVAHGGVFAALVKQLAMPNLRANNCSVYFFRPPDKEDEQWSICNLSEEKENFEL